MRKFFYYFNNQVLFILKKGLSVILILVFIFSAVAFDKKTALALEAGAGTNSTDPVTNRGETPSGSNSGTTKNTSPTSAITGTIGGLVSCGASGASAASAGAIGGAVGGAASLLGSAGEAIKSGVSSITNTISGLFGGGGTGASAAAAAADKVGLAQMGADAGLSGTALDSFVQSGGTLGSTAAGGGGIGVGALTVWVTDPTLNFTAASIAGTSGITAGNTTWQNQKDGFINCIFYNIAKMALRAITASIVSWAANGFQGNPSFIQDPARFFADVADQEIGRFIYNHPDYNWMCSPFRFQIKRALVFNRSFRERSQCTLSQVVGNFNDFVTSTNNELGNLGGWDAWNQIATEPQNNPYGAYALASMQVEAKIAGSKERNLMQLNWGKGFFSWKDPACVEASKKGQDPNSPYYEFPQGAEDPNSQEFEFNPNLGSGENCPIVTPGDVIAEQVNKTLGSGQDQLVAADEINEVISALIQGLVVKALGGGGLAGLGNSFSPGDYNYSAQLLAEDQQFFAQNKADSIRQVNDRIGVENQYIRVKNQTLPRVDSSANLVRSLISCYTGTTTPANSANPNVIAASSTLSSILSYKTNINRDAAVGEVNIRNLQKIIVSMNNLPYERRDQLYLIMQQFSDLFGKIHHEGDVVNAEFDRDFGIPSTLNEVDAATNEKINECRNPSRD